MDLTLMNLGPGSCSHLYSLAAKTFPTVQLLTLHTISRDPESIVRMINSLPNVTYPRLVGVGNDVVRAFAGGASGVDGVLCPNLSILECEEVDASFLLLWLQFRQTLLHKLYLLRGLNLEAFTMYAREVIHFHYGVQTTEAKHIWR
jgi:hypothetical protein